MTAPTYAALLPTLRQSLALVAVVVGCNALACWIRRVAGGRGR